MAARPTLFTAENFRQPFPGYHGGPAEECLSARAVSDDPRAPLIFRISDLWHRPWSSLWKQLLAAMSFELIGRPPVTDDPELEVLLIFCSPGDEAPLCLSAELIDREPDRFSCRAAPLPLSWRLAALRFGRTLPTRPDHRNWRPDPSPTSWITEEALRLRPDLAGPVDAFAPSEEYAEILLTLRSRFMTCGQLLKQSELPPQMILPFLEGLARAGIVTRAPQPFCHPDDPFDFFGLHWTAHDPLVRRRYEELSQHLDTHQSDDSSLYREHLENAFDILHRPEGRRKLRDRLIKTPAIGEVANYLHQRLRAYRRENKIWEAVDAGRRILEIDPGDEHARAVVHRLLCRLRQRLGAEGKME